MSGALFQVLVRGEEDTYISGEGFEAYRPFRQVFKRQTSFATELVDIDARFPTALTYGQSLTTPIPRKGDLLRGVVIKLQVKRAGGTTHRPALDLIDEVSLWAGKTLLERVTSGWMLIDHYLSPTQKEYDASVRLLDFDSSETQGSVKEFLVSVPFFTRKTPLPLIALQLQDLSIELKLRDAPLSLDPSVQPIVQVMCEFCFVDDDERRYFTKNPHRLLIETVQTQEDSFTMTRSNIKKIYETTVDTLAGYDQVTGSGSGETINLGDRIKIVDNPGWLGRTDIIYNQPAYSTRYDLEGRFSVPLVGSMGMGWATHTIGSSTKGYVMTFSVESNVLTVTFERDGEVVCVIGNESVTSSVYATVSGVSTSTDFSAQSASGEAWLVYDISHDLETDLLTLSVTVEGYVEGGYFADLAPVSTKTWNYTIKEGLTPLETEDVETTLNFYADAEYDMFFVPTLIQTQAVDYLPVSNNFNTISQRLFFRGPVRYFIWYYMRNRNVWEFGKFSTDVPGSTSVRNDIMESARVLINGKERLARQSNQFFTVYEANRLFGTGLPAGVHVYGYAVDRVHGLDPNGTMNHSRVGDVRLEHRLRSYNDIETNLIKLDESECLEAGKLFDRICVHAVSYNVINIENGRLLLLYM
jgi:hypothetical protein